VPYPVRVLDNASDALLAHASVTTAPATGVLDGPRSFTFADTKGTAIVRRFVPLISTDLTVTE